MPIEIAPAVTDADILDCFDVMALLRPHLTREGFVDRVRTQMAGGYQMAALRDEGSVRAVAGYRLLHQLAYGKTLYVDDLVTAESDRSKGYGNDLFDWLVEQGGALGMDELQLDSGVQRFAAHRFYFRKRMYIHAYHFRLAL
ncbi:MAG: GNAT family N-acetyltransferase [Acidobacteria bacterium]|nr:GNAT family N-acetyltransferase [Acidobacteriota bacterium]